MDIVYFDLETQRTAGDVGGWDKKEMMGMSIGVTYSSADGEYEIFPESGAGDLVERLRRADLVVGFNILRFDYEVLQAYTVLTLGENLPTLDLLVEIERAAGHRLKLEDVARGTLGIGKVAEGLDAIRWWREGKIMEIAEYC
jgi:DEAD/DEAH box helicase domain-containing protein